MKQRVTSPPPHLDAFNIDRYIAYKKVATLHLKYYEHLPTERTERFIPIQSLFSRERKALNVEP